MIALIHHGVNFAPVTAIFLLISAYVFPTFFYYFHNLDYHVEH